MGQNSVSLSSMSIEDYAFCSNGYKLIPKSLLPKETNFPDNPNVYVQHGESCTAFALKNMKEIQEFWERGVWMDLSAGWLYANRMAKPSTRDGLDMRLALKSLKLTGVCEQKDFPYLDYYKQLEPKFIELKDKISQKALPQVINEYGRLYNVDEIKSAIVLYKAVPCVIDVGSEISNGYGKEIIHTPKTYKDTGKLHSMVITNYKHIGNELYWKCLNAYGKDFGKNGYIWIQASHPMFKEFWFARDGKLGNNDDFEIEIKIGNKEIIKRTNFQEKVERFVGKVAAFITGGTTFLPVRVIAEALGLDVEWREDIQTVFLRNKK